MNKIKINNDSIVKFLFYFFPVPFILGNLIVTLHLFLFIIFSFILISKKKLKLRIDKACWLLIIFFLYLLLSTLFQYQAPGILYDVTESWPLESKPLVKSIALIRFLLLIFVIDTLFYNKILNLKGFLFSSLVCASFVSIDIIFQYFVGFDLLGLKSFGARNSGPFGDEMIAGAYLVKFSFISIFFLKDLIKNINLNKYLLISTITINTIAIFLAGQRMPTLLFFLGSFLVIVFLKNLRVVWSQGMLLSIIVFFAIGSNDEKVRNPYLNFLNDINVFEYIEAHNKKNKKEELEKQTEASSTNDKEISKFIFLHRTGHGRLYTVASRMWLDQPFYGHGLKAFRVKCHEYSPTKEKHLSMKILPTGCSAHPHNYYLEILAEAGIIGAFLLITFFVFLLKDAYYILVSYIKTQDNKYYFILPIIINFIIEIWPLRSSGSFFTTWNATFFWLCVGILIAVKSKKSEKF